MKECIAPTVFMSSEGAYSSYTRHLLAKAGGSPQQTLRNLEDTWEDIFPDRPLVASYLDAELEMRYQAEQRLGDIMITFSVLAILIAWYTMDWWLQDFAYHVPIGPVIFLVAGLLCLGIALLTVSYQALRTVRVNPVDSLRDE